MNFFPRLTLLLFAGLCWISPENYLLSFPAEPNDAPQPSLGKTIFDARCTPCHGINGNGDGVASALLNPRPRNFTSGMFKFRSTESGSLPTDDDLLSTIKNGLHGTAMSDWAPFMPWPAFTNMTEEDRHALVTYLRHIKPIKHNVSEWSPNSAAPLNSFYPYDYAEHEKKK